MPGRAKGPTRPAGPTSSGFQKGLAQARASSQDAPGHLGQTVPCLLHVPSLKGKRCLGRGWPTMDSPCPSPKNIIYLSE